MRSQVVGQYVSRQIEYVVLLVDALCDVVDFLDVGYKEREMFVVLLLWTHVADEMVTRGQSMHA